MPQKNLTDSIVKITWQGFFSSAVSVGTGVIIGPHTILTAAHVVEDSNGNVVTPGLTDLSLLGLTITIPGDSIPFAQLFSGFQVKVAAQFPGGVKTDSQSQSDWAIINFSSDVFAQYTPFVISSASGYQDPVDVAGYPHNHFQILDPGYGVYLLQDAMYPGIWDWGSSPTEKAPLTIGTMDFKGISGGPVYIDGTNELLGIVSTDQASVRLPPLKARIDLLMKDPVIGGTKGQQDFLNGVPILPLSGVTIADFNGASQVETVTVQLSVGANGSLSDPIAGSYNSGVYTVTGSADEVTAAINALEFIPDENQSGSDRTLTPSLTITVSDTAGYTSTAEISFNVEQMVAMTSGTQTVSVTGTINDPITHKATTYSAGARFEPIAITFPTMRTDSPLPSSVPVTVTYVEDNPDPNGGNEILINQGIISDPFFTVASGANLSPLNPTATLNVALVSSAAGNTHQAGDYRNQLLPLDLGYEGGLGSSTFDLDLAIKIYAPAIPEFLINGVPTFNLNFGVIHVGETATIGVEISNAATGDLTDLLSSNTGVLGEFSAVTSVNGLAAGSAGAVAVTFVGAIAGPAFVPDGSPMFGLVSHDSDLPDEIVAPSGGILSLLGDVLNYAVPAFVNTGSVGTLTQHSAGDWTLDLGRVTLGLGSGPFANIEIANAAPTLYSDTLSGSLNISTSPDGGFFQGIPGLTGLFAPGGGFMELGDFAPDSRSLGAHKETIVFNPLSVDTAGTTALQSITLTVTDNVVLPDISGATITNQGSTITASVQAGQVAVLDPLFAAGMLDTLIIQGPGTAEIDGFAVIGNLEIASGGSLLLQGAIVQTDPVTVDANGNMTGNGQIAATAGNYTVNGTVTASGGILDISGNINGAGTLTFDPGGTLYLEGTVAVTESVLFDAPNEILGLGPTAEVLAPLSGFAAGDFIGLAGQQVTSAIYDVSQHTLAVTGSGGGVYSLAFTGTYQQSDFAVTNGAVGITCFVSGTRIATKHGGMRVEEFTIGELVQTKFGGLAPIKWIGHRRIDCSRHPDPRKVRPVRIITGAFGENLPHRDLWLSPDHAVFVDGVLIPVKYLINGCTITQEPRDEVTYFHIELERHDVLFAEGLPAESYLDTGDRSNFENGGGPVRLHPDFSARIWEAMGCAPLIVTGPIVASVRARLLQCAAKLASQPKPRSVTSRAV